MKIIIEIDDIFSKENVIAYTEALNIDDEFIKSIRFVKDDENG